MVIRWLGAFRKGSRTLAEALDWEFTQTGEVAADYGVRYGAPMTRQPPKRKPSLRDFLKRMPKRELRQSRKKTIVKTWRGMFFIGSL